MRAYLAIDDSQRHGIVCADCLQLGNEGLDEGPQGCIHPLVGPELRRAAQGLPMPDHELMQAVRVHELIILPGFQHKWVCLRLRVDF